MPFRDIEDVIERLKSPENLPARLEKTIEHHKTRLGKTPGAKDIPFEIKKVIAEVSQESSMKDVQNAFGISQREVGFLKAGETSSGPVKELQEVVKKKKADAADRAINILLEGLEVLPGKLAKEKPKVISSVCKDMAQISESLREKGIGENANIAFHLYAPAQKSIDDYEVIDV